MEVDEIIFALLKFGNLAIWKQKVGRFLLEDRLDLKPLKLNHRKNWLCHVRDNEVSGEVTTTRHVKTHSFNPIGLDW